MALARTKSIKVYIIILKRLTVKGCQQLTPSVTHQRNKLSGVSRKKTLKVCPCAEGVNETLSDETNEGL